MTDTSQISNMLGAFSAGLSGNLPQWQQAQNLKQQLGMQEKEAEAKRVQERRKTMFIDADAAKKLLAQGNVDGVIQIGLQRLDYLKQLGVDPSDTQRLTSLAIGAKNGSAEAMKLLNDELDTTIQVGIASGMIEAPKGPETIKASDLYNGQLVQRGTDGKPIALDVENLRVETPEKFEIVSGDKAAALGLDPKQQYKINPKTGEPTAVGGGGVTVRTGADPMDAAYGDMYKDILKSFPAMIEQASVTGAAAPQIAALKQLAGATTEGRAGALLANLFPGSEFADANVAYSSIVNQLLPSMRTPGSGAQSDKDIEVLTKSFGGLESSNRVKMLVLESLENKNKINQQLADIAEKVIAKELTPQEAIKRRRALESKSIIPSELQSRLNKVIGASSALSETARAAGVTEQEWNQFDDEEKKRFP